MKENTYQQTGYPMGLKVMSMAHSYGVAYAEDILFVTVKVRNESGAFTAYERDKNGNVVWSYSQGGANANIARAQKYALDYFDEINDGISGDLNDDGILNILDIVSLINLVLSEEFETAGDLNDDGIINILDIVSLVNLILDN